MIHMLLNAATYGHTNMFLFNLSSAVSHFQKHTIVMKLRKLRKLGMRDQSHLQIERTVPLFGFCIKIKNKAISAVVISY